MIMKYEYLSQHPNVFKTCTGLTVELFDELYDDISPQVVAMDEERLSRPDRQRAIGAGHPFDLNNRDQVLLTIIWLRLYPIHEVLAYLFGTSDPTVSRMIDRLLPVLEQAGRDTLRLPDPGKKRRRKLNDLLTTIPELTVIVDTFEQRVQRPQDHEEQKQYFSGKKKQHTFKSQVVIDGQTGQIVDISDSVPEPTADITLLDQSGLLARIPAGVGISGDLGYLGLAKRHPLGHIPRRKPRDKERPPENVLYNTAFAQYRIDVEHVFGRMRRYQSITQMDRNHREDHTARVTAIAGLVNRRAPYRVH